jgi:hypothetical protein
MKGCFCFRCGSIVYPSKRDLERKTKICLCGSSIPLALTPKHDLVKPQLATFTCDLCHQKRSVGLTVLLERHFVNDLLGRDPHIFKAGAIVCTIHVDTGELIPCGKDIL